MQETIENETVWNPPSHNFLNTGSLRGAIANVTACFFAHAGVAMVNDMKGQREKKNTEDFRDHLRLETLCCRIGRFMCMASLQIAFLFGNILTVLCLERWYMKLFGWLGDM